MNTRQVLEVLPGGRPHWVGDGFHVRSLFSPQETDPRRISPFLLLDYAPPTEFPPTDEPRGVDVHPHKGFETVTIVYQGALEHRDSTGSRGTIGPGDVQWMTAASGILHEEKHERTWSGTGGVFQVVQLWVNLPARFKSAPPGYQTLLRDQIPALNLSDGAGSLRVIAGDFQGTKGPAKTFTPINLFDVRLQTGKNISFDLPAGHNTAVAVLEGRLRFDATHVADAGAVVLFDAGGGQMSVEAERDAMFLVLDGLPIDEPVVSYGPFVMNTREEITQAVEDFRSGKMGRL